MHVSSKVLALAVLGVLAVGVGIFFVLSTRESSLQEGQKVSEVADTTTALESCLEITGAQERVQCLLPVFYELAVTESAEVSLTKARELYEQKKVDECHIFAHEVGNANFEKFSPDVGAAFATCPMGCLEGCFHGVMEGYVDTKANLDDVTAEIPSLCGTLGTDTKLRIICVHGMGHGLLRHELSTLIETARRCETLPAPADQAACLTGVYMENMNNYLTVSETRLVKALPSICAPVKGTMEDYHLGLCLQAVGEGMMGYTRNDPTRAEALCGNFSGAEREFCLEGVDQIKNHPERQI